MKKIGMFLFALAFDGRLLQLQTARRLKSQRLRLRADQLGAFLSPFPDQGI
jgi:hypothetical protein